MSFRTVCLVFEKRFQWSEELGTISGALTLLANIVMAWNTHHLQVMLAQSPGGHPDEVISRVAPIGHKHVNMRGILTFRYCSLQIKPASPTALGYRRPGVELKKLETSKNLAVLAVS